VAKGFFVEVRQFFEFCSTPDKEYTFYRNHDHFSLIITMNLASCQCDDVVSDGTFVSSSSIVNGQNDEEDDSAFLMIMAATL
jgi:hypothetical protein